jgi:predicted site-specific integrase-resolvase
MRPRPTPKREQVILALLTEKTFAAAAEKADIAESTLHRWFKDKEFRDEYEEAKRRLKDETISELARQRASRLALIFAGAAA